MRNNPEKFPSGYFFTLKPSEKQYVVENFHRMENLKKSTVEPKAFTEKGLYMLATILKSPRATQTTIAIIDSFIKLRELIRNVDAIQNEPDLIKQKVLAYLNERGAWCFTSHGGSQYQVAGLPDVIASYKGYLILKNWQMICLTSIRFS